jgi:transposase
MGRVNTPVLSEAQRAELENGLKTGQRHAFRMRCQSILLKADGRTSTEVGSIVGLCQVSINSWLKRYNTEGISGLWTKEGRGRKPKIDKTTDESAVVASVKANRQRLQTAKAEWESQSGKHVSKDTLRRFLKALTDDTDA